ncbi:MAG: copper amine oxidase N-terminal domain-containing protein, partial [Syntrophomonadaceae bacterium]|nr:copper amine oxidase N-terminal domain-containing protein [Syntrophomonadaceae bacterium]
MKKSVALSLVVAMLCSMVPIVSNAAEKVTVVPTSSVITVDGLVTGFEAYQINQNNYFKLRDIAYALNGTDAQFNVNWNAESKSIDLIKKEAYSATGEEFQSAGNKVYITAYESSATIFIDGQAAPMKAYTINGNTYFKLRDLGSYLGFGVGWDAQKRTVSITSNSNMATRSTQVTSTNTKKIDYHWEYPIDWLKWDYSLEIPVAVYEAYESVDRNLIYGYTEYISEESDDEYLSQLTQKFVDAAEENEFNDNDTVYLIITFVQALDYMSDLETTGYD